MSHDQCTRKTPEKVRQELAEGKVQRITRAQSGSPWVTPADYDEDPDDPLLTLARDIHRRSARNTTGS